MATSVANLLYSHCSAGLASLELQSSLRTRRGVLLLATGAYWFATCLRRWWRCRGLPPRCYLAPIRDLVGFIADTDHFVEKRFAYFGGSWTIEVMMDPAVMLAPTAENIKLLSSQVEHGWPSHFIRVVGEKGVGMSDGKDHKRRRVLSGRALVPAMLDESLPFLRKMTSEHMEKWVKLQAVQPMRGHIKVYTFSIAQELILGEKLSDEEMLEYSNLFDTLIGQGLSPILPFDLPGLPYHNAMMARKKLVAKYQKFIDRKKANPVTPPKAMIDHVLEGGMVDGKDLDDQELQDFCVNFIFAGHDTTLGTLETALHLLSENPEVLAELREEVDKKWDGTSEVSRELVNSLWKCHAFIAETLRLWPPVQGSWRTLSKDVVVDGVYHVPAGFKITLPSVATMRRTYGAENFDKINLSRWLDDDGRYVDKVHDFSHYSAFGLGARMCIGYKMAQDVMAVFLLELLKHYDYHVVQSKKIPFPVACYEVTASFNKRA